MQAMTVTLRADRTGNRARLVPAGAFDLAHASTVAAAVADVQPRLEGCQAIEIDLSGLDRIDGSGAALLATLLDRLDPDGGRTRVVEGDNPEAARLVALYRGHAARDTRTVASLSALGRVGAAAAAVPGTVVAAFDFLGRSAVAFPKAIAAPRSVDWRSLPRLLQEIGADALLVTSAANLLIGVIIGFLGVSQLGRFGAVAFVPELVVVTQFRELGPLVTAIVVAGRSGAGLASELATMQVSEEIDALRAMGFDPVRWLVVPRCLALVATVPLLTWIGNALSLIGGLLATSAITDLTPRAYVLSTADHITGAHFFSGMIKTPFLGLIIGLIA